MTPAEFNDALDHLAKVNGFTRRQIDDAVFKARAAVFKQAHRIASDAEVLNALQLALASDATRREMFGDK